MIGWVEEIDLFANGYCGQIIDTLGVRLLIGDRLQ